MERGEDRANGEKILLGMFVRERVKKDPALGHGVITIGEHPFGDKEFDEILRAAGLETRDHSAGLEIVVVGPDPWLEEQGRLDREIIEAIRNRTGEDIRIYSQELFLNYLYTGEDIFRWSMVGLQLLARGHPVLERLSAKPIEQLGCGWRWPMRTLPATGRGPLSAEMPNDGMLSSHGYRVGRHGLPTDARQAILRDVFESKLYFVHSRQYTEEWGAPRSSDRLSKLAWTLSALAENAARRSSASYGKAIEDWTSDLEWLRKSFYEPDSFRFQWPDPRVK
jgi:hypothetical protein